MKWPWSKKSEGAAAGGAASGGMSPGGDDMSASTILTGNPVEDSRSLEILLDTIAAVTANIDLDSVLRDIVDRSLQVTSAERALLLLGSDPEGLTVRVAQDKDGASLSGELQWSRSLVKKCLEDGYAVRSVVQSDQEALEVGRSVYDLKLRAVMCAPMRAKDRTVGVIYVDSRAVRREFSARDLALFGAISAQLAISVENARLHADSLAKAKLQKDVEIARRIQQHLLPTVPDDIDGLEVALRYEAAEQASGDTYDLVPLRNGRYAIMIGDVTGHGVGAALLTHTVTSALRSYLELIDDIADVVARVNQRLVDSVETGNFMSLLLMVVDPKKRHLEYVNAGHPGVLVCQKDGSRVLEKTGMVLGVVGDQAYEKSPVIELGAGDVLFAHTDGVDEAMSPSREVFGTDRLHALVQEKRLAGAPAEAVLSEIMRQVHAHTGTDVMDDDFTMITARIG
ncbi:MAG: PP2C family protein-serine/threonine phosphatase [Planctomycetota bacterium]